MFNSIRALLGEHGPPRSSATLCKSEVKKRWIALAVVLLKPVQWEKRAAELR